MASRGSDEGRHLPLQDHHHHHHHHHHTEPAVREAQRWIEVRDVMPLRYSGIQCVCVNDALAGLVSVCVCVLFLSPVDTN